MVVLYWYHTSTEIVALLYYCNVVFFHCSILSGTALTPQQHCKVTAAAPALQLNYHHIYICNATATELRCTNIVLPATVLQ